jgi:hypothetical protein
MIAVFLPPVEDHLPARIPFHPSWQGTVSGAMSGKVVWFAHIFGPEVQVAAQRILRVSRGLNFHKPARQAIIVLSSTLAMSNAIDERYYGLHQL